MYVYCFVCLYVCSPCACPWKPEEGIRSPGARVIDNCELPSGYRSSRRAANAINHWTTSPALTIFKSKTIFSSVDKNAHFIFFLAPLLSMAFLITIYIGENKLIYVPPKSLVNNQEASLKTIKTNQTKPSCLCTMQKLQTYRGKHFLVHTRHNEIVESFVSKTELEKF